ncbi:MAG: hypothetical protein R3F43_18190 [bacterium]
MDELVTAGVSEALSVALGLDSDEVGLSAEASSPRSRRSSRTWSRPHQFGLRDQRGCDAIDMAQAYFRQSNSEAQLLSSADRAWDCYAGSSALNDMESIGRGGHELLPGDGGGRKVYLPAGAGRA